MACELQADPSIDWLSDSYSAFDVILGGSGPGWSGTVTSPSGLWQLSSQNVIEYPYTFSAGGPAWVHIQNFGLATFLGGLPPQLPPPGSETLSISPFGTYNDYFEPVAPINDGTPLDYGSLYDIDWLGGSTISVTSIPSVDDISAWTWTAEYYASGPSLEVPEPRAIFIGTLAAILGLAPIFRKKAALSGN